MKRLLSISLLIFFMHSVYPQENLQADAAHQKLRPGAKKQPPKVVTAIIIDNDTVPVVNLPVFRVLDKRTFKSKRTERKYYKLARDVQKVYPYAKLAGNLLKAYNDTLAQMGNEVKRKKYMKKVEARLKDEFGNQLKTLTVNQGRILIRLVDRETGDTSYKLVKELRGAFSAFFWQTLAKIFGHSLKTKYNPENYVEDRVIEEIIVLIEDGVYK